MMNMHTPRGLRPHTVATLPKRQSAPLRPNGEVGYPHAKVKI